MSSSLNFSSHVDSIDLSPSRIVLGLSNLEGNIWDGALKLYSIEASSGTSGFSMKEMYSQKCSAGVSMCRFAGDHHEIIVASRDDGNIALYSPDSLDLIAMYCAHDDVVSAIAINPNDRNQFASCGWDGSIKIWNVATIISSTNSDKPTTPILMIRHAHYKQVNDIAFNPQNSTMLCSAGQDGFIRLWDLQSSNPGESECVCIYNLHQSLSCILWDMDQSVDETSSPRSPFFCNQHLFVGTDAGDVIIIDMKLDNTGGFKSHKLHGGRVRRLAQVVSSPSQSSAHNLLLSASDDTTVVVSTLSTSAYSPDSEEDFVLPNPYRMCCHKDYVTDLSLLSPAFMNEAQSGSEFNSKSLCLPASSSTGTATGSIVSILTVASDKTLHISGPVSLHALSRQ